MDLKQKIEKLNNSNYFSWKFKMMMLLRKDDLWQVISTARPNSESRQTSWNKKDEKALALIALSVEDSQFVYIREKQNALDSWNALKDAHELDSVTNRISLYKQISSFQMKENDDVELHMNKLVSLFQRLFDLGAESDDEWKIGMLFSSLPPSYSNLITVLEGRKSEELNWNLVHSKIMDESIRRKMLSKRNETEENDKFAEKVYKVTKLFCNFCKRDNHQMANCLKLKHYKEFHEFSEMMKKEKEEKQLKEEKEKEGANLIEHNEFEDENMCLCISEIQSKDTEIHHNKKNMASLIQTLKKIMNFTIEQEYIGQNINQLSELFKKLQNLDFQITDDIRTALLLNSLEKNHPDLVANFQNTSLNWNNTIKEVKKYFKRITRRNKKIKNGLSRQNESCSSEQTLFI